MNSDLTQIPPQGHFATINGIQMYYEVYGAGSPLLLLHGYTGSSLQWRPYSSAFAQHFQVIVPDLRGHGRSLDPTNQFTLAQAAQDIFALLAHLGIDRCRGIGCSAGGCILQYMSTAQPTRLEAMILESCGSYFSAQTRSALYAWAKSDDAALALNQHHHLHGLRQMRTLVNQLPQIIEDYGAHPPDVAKFTAQTLIVLGDRDPLYPVQMAVELYTAIANAELWIIPGEGHACIVEKPDKYAAPFIDTALTFLSLSDRL